MKKHIIFIVILCLILTACGMKEEGTAIPSESAASDSAESLSRETDRSVQELRKKEYFELAEMTASCPFIFKGTCTGVISENGKQFYEVRAEVQYQGNLPQPSVPVDSVSMDLKAGESYYFLLHGIESVYSEIAYYQKGDILQIDENNVVHSDLIQDCEALPALQWEEILKDAIAKHPFQGESAYLGAYLHSDDLNEILACAGVVVLLEPVELIPTLATDRESYRCRVISCLKGETDESIWVVFKPETVREGEKFLAALKSPEERSTIYSLIARNCVFPENSYEAERIRELLKAP